MGPIYSLSDFLDMVRRRIGLISFCIIFGCMASVFYALAQPHSYRSAEVIQIKQPKIDSELAPTTVAGSSARRLQLIEQQVMSRGSLLEIIEKFGLFSDQPDLLTADKVNLLRQSVSITGVAAVREGFADDGAIAVLTFTAEMPTPELAQSIAHEVADRTRALTLKQRQEQTEETLAFFSQQFDKLTDELALAEDELAAFRTANDLSIEGSLGFLRDEISSLNEAILTLDREIIATQLARNRIDRSQRASTVERQESELQDQLDSLTNQRTLLEARRSTLADSIETSPEVERELAKFERRITSLQGQLNVIATRRSEAEVGFSLESAARGERLTTIEEAPLPDYPISMSRKKLAMMGGVASVGLGLVLAFLMELRRPIVRTARQMERETGLRPVVSIPDMRGDKQRRDGKRAGWTQMLDNRRAAGKRGRAARLARNPDLRKG